MVKPRTLTREWMHRLELAGDSGRRFVLRVWTKAESLKDISEHATQADEILRIANQPGPLEDRMERLAALADFVTAIELVDMNGNGRLVYVDWP